MKKVLLTLVLVTLNLKDSFMNKNNFDRILIYLLSIFIILYLGFRYVQKNPDVKIKSARNITIFANDNFTAKRHYHNSNLILNFSLLINPKDSFTYQVLGYNNYQLAYIYVHNDLFKEYYLKKAFAYSEKALSLSPKYYEIIDNLGFCCILDEKFDEAIELFNNSLKINPKDTVAIDGLTSIYSKYKIDSQKALSYIDLKIKYAPNDFDAFFTKAWILNTLDRNKEAIEYYNKYLERYPYSVAALVNISGCEVKIKDYKNALIHTERGLALNRYSCYLLASKIDILANMKKYDEAKAVAQELINNSTYYGAHLGYFRLAKIQQIEGKTKLSETNFKIAKDIAQEFLDSEYCQGKGYDLKDNDGRCRNVGLFLKFFDIDKQSKYFY